MPCALSPNDHHRFDVSGDDLSGWFIDAATAYGPAVRLVGVYVSERHAREQVRRFQEIKLTFPRLRGDDLATT